MKRLLIMAFILIGIGANAQINQSLRREFPLTDNYSDYEVALFGEKGIIIFGNDLVGNFTTRRWQLTKLDNNFNSIDSVTIDLPRQLTLQSTYTIGDRLAMMFVSYKRQSYHLSILDFNTMQIKSYNGRIPKKAYLGPINVIGDMAFMSMSLKKARFVFTIDLRTGSSKQNLIKVSQGNKLWIENVEVDTVNSEAYVYVGYYMKSKHTGMMVQIYDDRAGLVETIKLAGAQDHNLTSISASRIAHGHYLFTGTYSKSSAVYGEGLFICEFVDGDRTFLKYYNFLDFKNFTNYLPKRKQEKIERKKKRREARGSELAYNYRMVSHQLISRDGKYYYLGESYFPTYRTETYQTYINGRWVTQTRTVFDGYQYTHAVLACFDKEGELIWDNTFEMWPSFKPYRIIEFITQSIDPDGRIDLLFASRNAIFMKSFNTEGKIMRESNYTGIATRDDDERVKYSLPMMEHWYGNTFLTYGHQRIKDKSQKVGQKTRSVFFMNKVSPE